MRIISSDREVKKLPDECKAYGDYGVTELWLFEHYKDLRYWKAKAKGEIK